MINSKYLIFDRDGDYYEYNAKDAFEAIDKYVSRIYADFHITSKMWDKIKDSCKDIEERINLVNELCDYSSNKIEKIITGYTYLFGNAISPAEDETLN